jgi:hypothetical protein
MYATALLRRHPENLTVLVVGETAHIAVRSHWEQTTAHDAAFQQAAALAENIICLLRYADNGEYLAPLVEHLETHVEELASREARSRSILTMASDAAVAYYAATKSALLAVPRALAQAKLAPLEAAAALEAAGAPAAALGGAAAPVAALEASSAPGAGRA